MIDDKVSLYAKAPILSIGPDSPLLDAISIMSDRRVRRLRVSMAGGYRFITIDTIINVLSGMAKLFASSDPLKGVKVGSLNTVTPPLLTRENTVREAARVMLQHGVDFSIVPIEDLDYIVTIRDIIDAVEEGDIGTPALNYSTKSYPSIYPTSKLIEAVKAMSLHKVRSLLVVDFDNIAVGAISSRQVLDLISSYGYDVLNETIEQAVSPLRAYGDPGDTIDKIAKIMREKTAELVIINVGTHILGVIDEIDILQAVAGRPKRRLRTGME